MNWTRRQAVIGIGLAAAAPLVFPASRGFASEPFRIGALNPVSGAGSAYGAGMQRAILFSAEEVNAAGGAGGAPLEILAEDTQTSPEAGVLAAKKLIDVNRVRAILGTWSSAVALAVVPVSEEADVIHMTNAGTSALAPLNTKGLIYRLSAPSARTGESLAAGALQDNRKRVSVMGINNASGREVAEGAARVLRESGVEVVSEIIYEPNQPSYRSEVQQALSGDPEVIMFGSFLPDMTVIAREIRQRGSTIPLMAPAWAVTPKLIEALGPEAAEGIVSADYVSALDSEAYAHFKERFTAETGEDADSNYYAACAYDMVQVLALAIEAAGADADNATIASAVRDVGNPDGIVVTSFADGKQLLNAGEAINYDGASGPLDFDERGDADTKFKLSIVREGKVEFLRVL